MLTRLKSWLCTHNVHLVRVVVSGDIESTRGVATIVRARHCVWCEQLWVLDVHEVNLEEPS